MAATFRVVVDSSGVQAAFAIIERQSQRVNRAIAGDTRRTTDEGARAFGSYRDAAVRSVAQRQAAETRLNGVRARLAAEATSIVERQVEMGVTLEERAASEKERIYRRLALTYIREEQRKTEADRREAAVRATIMDTLAARAVEHGVRGAGRLARAGFRVASGAASDVIGQAREARQASAGTERTLGGALFQVGADRPDVAAATRQVQAYAAAHGMDSAQLSQAIAGAQGQFSVLENRPGEHRSLSDRLGSTLETARLGRNVGADPGEFLRLQGLLAQQGMDPASQRQMLLFAAGAAQHGAVELGDLTSASLPAITRRMATANAALGANATPEQRQAAQRSAFVQSVSELEVGAAFGNSPGQAGHALANLTGALGGSVVQGRMLANIRNSRDLTSDQRTRLQASLFDAHGHLQTTNALEVSERFAAVAGDNPALMANVFAGGGHGNARGLQANWSRVMGFMMSPNAEGATGAQRIRSLMDPSTALTDADVDRGERVFGQDTQAQLTAQHEQNIQALMSNTAALTALNAMDAYKAGHPVEAAVAQQVGGDAALLALSHGGSGPDGRLGVGDMSDARRAAGISAAGGRASFAWRALTSGGAGPYDPGADTDPAFHQRYQAALQREVAARGGSVTETNLSAESMRGLSNVLTGALQSAGLTAHIDERTAQHAVATTRGAPSGETHEAHH